MPATTAHTRWLAVIMLAVLMTGVDARMAVQLNHKRALAARQVTVGPNDPGPAASTPPSNNGAVVQSSSSAEDDAASTGGLLDSILNPGTPSQSNTAQSSASSSASASLSSSSSASSRSSASSSSRSIPASSSEDVLTLEITSTASIASSSSPAASAESQQTEDKPSGVGKKTLIIVISVASAVGLVAAIWTLLRKWKFSPSRRFNERLNPIDWNMDSGDADAKMLIRTASQGSGAHSLNRHNSFGSANGGQAMSERGGVLSEINGHARPAPAYHSAAPAFPPGFGSSQMPPLPPHSLANPYEQVTRQATVMTNGGRYGEGYTRR